MKPTHDKPLSTAQPAPGRPGSARGWWCAATGVAVGAGCAALAQAYSTSSSQQQQQQQRRSGAAGAAGASPIGANETTDDNKKGKAAAAAAERGPGPSRAQTELLSAVDAASEREDAVFSKALVGHRSFTLG